MATVAELLVKIGADSSGLRKEIAASQRQLKRAFGPEALKMSSGAAGILAGIATAMGAVGVASIVMSSKARQAKSALEALLGSGSEATQVMKDLQSYSANTTFEFNGLADTAKSMLAIGIQGQDILPIIASVGDAIGTLGGGTEALQGVVRSLMQIQTKGKASAQEISQIAAKGIPAWRYLAESTGKTVDEVKQMVSEGAISSKTAINSIVGGMATQFKGGAEAAKNEVTGQFESMQKTASDILAKIGDDFTDALDLKKRLGSFSNDLKEFSSAIESCGIKNAILGLVPPEATAAVFALGGALVAVAIPAIYTFAGGVWLAIAPMTPFIALGVTIGLLAYEIWKNWEPLGDLFSATWNTITAGVDKAWSEIKRHFYSGVQSVLKMMAPLANLLGGGIATAVNEWLDSVPGKIEEATSQAAEANEKLAASLKDVKKAASEIKIGMTAKDISKLLPENNKLNTEFTGLHGGDKSAQKAAKKAVDATAKEWEKLKDKVKQITESIEREWVQTTKTELEQLDIWYAEQIKVLDETAAANENYERDKERVATVYAARRRKILQNEARNAISIQREIADNVRKFSENTISFNLEGSSAQEFDIFQGAKDSIRDMERQFEDLAAKWETATETEKKTMRDAFVENGLLFEEIEEGKIAFAEESARRRVEIERQAEAEIAEYRRQGQALQDNLDAARREGDLQAYAALLQSESALFQQELSGRQEMIDTYYQMWQDSHRSAMSYMAELTDGMYSGLKDCFSSIFDGTTSLKDAWSNLGQSILSTIANMAAQWVASQIMMAAFGNSMQATQAATAAAAGATVAAAWSTAASMVSLATLGANSVPAMAGITATTALSASLASVAGFATGGQVTGPGTGTSDSILARLSHGEYVINAAATKAVGTDYLDSINQGQLPAFATGGIVTGPSLESLSVARHINTSDGDSAESEESQQQAPTQYIMNVSAMDVKSFERYLENGAGRKIEKYMTKRGREFALTKR